MWLSGLSAGLRIKGSPVQFPVRAYAWVVGQVRSGGAHERQPHIDLSLPLFLPPFSSVNVNKVFKTKRMFDLVEHILQFQHYRFNIN